MVEGSWRYDPAARRIEIELIQTQAGAAYRLPFELGVMDGAEMRIAKVEMTGKRQQFQIVADKAPASVVLDPNTWVLMQARFEHKSP